MPTVMQWVKLLLEKIDAQAAYAERYEVRYRNEYVLPFIAKEYQEVYGADPVNSLLAIQPPRAGVAAITIDALVDRLTILGAASSDEALGARAVAVVERAWEENDLDVMHREAHRESLIKARSFAQVDRTDDGRAVVGIEAPEQMAVHREMRPPYDVDAALKISKDEWTGQMVGQLRLPGRRIDLVKGKESLPDPEGSPISSPWRVVDETDGPTIVPVVEFTSRARLLAEPVSELDPIESLVDLADLIEGLMVFAGHFGAVPIRYATGLDIPRDPKDPSRPLLGPDGKPAVGFNPRADHMWFNSNKDARFGQLTPAGLESFVTWAEHASSRIRAKTSVASTYYSMDLKSHMSAELLKTDEAPMIRRINAMGRDGSYGQAWRRLDRMILAVENPSLAQVAVRPRWADPQTRIETQDADTFAKLAPHLGARTVAELVLDWSPEEAERGIAEAAGARAAAMAVDPVAAMLAKDDGGVDAGGAAAG